MTKRRYAVLHMQKKLDSEWWAVEVKRRALKKAPAMVVESGEYQIWKTSTLTRAQIDAISSTAVEYDTSPAPDLEVTPCSSRSGLPSLGRLLAYFLLPARRQEEVMGDLAERFNTRWLPDMGAPMARCCYVIHVIRISGVLAVGALLAAIKLTR